MPCYLVQQCNVELNNADHTILAKALKTLGYEVRVNAAGQILSFTKDGQTGTYNGKQLTMPKGATQQLNKIKQEYSRQVIRKQGERARKMGWDFVKIGDEYVFKAPQNRQARIFA